MLSLDERKEQATAPILKARAKAEEVGRKVIRELVAAQQELAEATSAAEEAIGEDSKAYQTAEAKQVAAEVRRRHIQAKLRKLAEKGPQAWELELQEARARAEVEHEAELEAEIKRLSAEMRETQDDQRFLRLQGQREDLREELALLREYGGRREQEALRDLQRKAVRYRAELTPEEFLAWAEDPTAAKQLWVAALFALYRPEVQAAAKRLERAVRDWRQAQVAVMAGHWTAIDATKHWALAVQARTRDNGEGKPDSLLLVEVEAEQ